MRWNSNHDERQERPKNLQPTKIVSDRNLVQKHIRWYLANNVSDGEHCQKVVVLVFVHAIVFIHNIDKGSSNIRLVQVLDKVPQT